MASIDTFAVQRHTADAAFGKPLIQNNLRAFIVEAMIDLALPKGWRWCSTDWAACDFVHTDGTRLEVKQSAAKQTWAAPKVSSPRRFDIAPRTGRWEGANWIVDPGRYAHVYVFGDHPITDDTADQRDPTQWIFYVTSTAELPISARSISINRIREMATQCSIGNISETVERLRLDIKREDGHPAIR